MDGIPLHPRVSRGPTPRGAMTRYDDMDESGGGVSVSGYAPGPPRPAGSDSRGDTDWQLALYGPEPEEIPDPRAGRDGGDGGQAGAGPRWQRPSRHTLLGAAAIIAMFAVVATSLAAYAKYPRGGGQHSPGERHRGDAGQAAALHRGPEHPDHRLRLAPGSGPQVRFRCAGHHPTLRCCCISPRGIPALTSSASREIQWSPS